MIYPLVRGPLSQRDVNWLDMIYQLRGVREGLNWVRAIDWLYVSQQLSLYKKWALHICVFSI